MAKWEKIDKNKVALEVSVEEDKVEEALSEAYRKIVGKIHVPGFRKGKVPRRVLEARFGPEVLYEDALEILVPDAYEKAVKETELEPIDRPDVSVKQMEPGKPLIFEAKVEVKPEVELGQYKGIEVKQVEPQVTEEDVKNYLKEMQEKHGKIVVSEEGVITEGDIAVIDFTGYLNGEPFEGGKGDNYSLEVGSGTFIPGFEEQLVGCKLGEEKEIKVNFPENYQSEELSGKEVVFNVKINEIKRKEIPDLDDDFAKEVSDFDTFEELKQDAMNKLKENAEKEARVELENSIVEKVAENATVEIPRVLVDQEIERVMNEFMHQLRMQGMTFEQYCQITNKTQEDIENDNRPEAEKRVKANLTIDAIIREEGIVAEEADVEEKIQKMAKQYYQDPEDIKSYLEAQGQLSMITREITFRKAIDFLVDEAKIIKTQMLESESESESETKSEPLEAEQQEQ